MAENFVVVFELYAEHRVGEQFHHAAAHLEQFFLGQKSTSVRVFGRALSASRRKREARRTGGAGPTGGGGSQSLAGCKMGVAGAIRKPPHPSEVDEVDGTSCVGDPLMRRERRGWGRTCQRTFRG
ncbi:hypothetical protein WR25_03842 [Diploscapter pachys]|uniref:Uncharacterized protein n=1 Tax=Diploscapter pachys TaxID=2018661 RepID=A0A2A2JZR2_9BILA|nr:hypothetical protein WR25_03842 [Diploscapter pachys]